VDREIEENIIKGDGADDEEAEENQR